MKQSIVHIALVVRDYDEALDFYLNKLNFTLIEDTYQPEQDKRWVVICSTRVFRRDLAAGACFQTGTGALHRQPDRRTGFLIPQHR